MRLISASVVLIFSILPFAFAACGDDTTGGGGSGSGTGGGSGTQSGGTGGSSSSDLGYCGRTCSAVADCCQGVPGCPGPYPNNYECQDGFCFSAGCSTNQECTFGG